MHVVIDGTYASYNMKGMGGYAVRTISSIKARNPGRTSVVVPSGRRATLDPSVGAANDVLEIDPTCGLPADFWEQLTHWGQRDLAAALDSIRPDVFFGPVFAVPCSWPGPSVVSILDVMFEQWPEQYAASAARYYSTVGADSARRADIVVVPSTDTQEQISERWSIPRTKIRIVPAAGTITYAKSRDHAAQQVATQLGVHQPYLLFLNAKSARKNFDLVLKSLSYPAGEWARHTTLIVVDGYAGRVQRQAQEAGVQCNVVVTGQVDNDLLAALFSAAHALLYPSHYEGFGLPPLEAMACGTPVIASTAGAIPETVGDAALLVDPNDSNALRCAVNAVMTDFRLRSHLAERGSRRSKSFSWARSGDQMMAILEEAIGLHKTKSNTGPKL